MKSLLISGTYFPPQVGGISHFMASLCEALGPERACCLTGVREATRHEEKGTLVSPVHVYRRPRAFAGPTMLQGAAWAAAVTEIMLRERPDVVQLATVAEGYLGLWLRRWLHLPYVVFAHGNEILAAEKGAWDTPRRALREADRVIAVSRFTASILRDRIGVDPARLVIMHPGCDVDRFRPVTARASVRERLLGSRTSANVLLTVANLVRRKGHEVVLQALPRVRERFPDVVYVIVGDGPYRPELERLTASLGLGDSVAFAGRIPADELPDAYALSDVFVMPSRAQLELDDVEGFGMVYIEANACGKPVVGGRSGGIADAVVDGETGLLVAPDDPSDVAATLERLLADASLRQRLGAQGRARALADFTWGGFAIRLDAVLESARRDRRPSRSPRTAAPLLP